MDAVTTESGTTNIPVQAMTPPGVAAEAPAAAAAPAPAADGAAGAPVEASTEPTNTSFKFQHKVFDVAGAVFKMDRVAHTVALHIQLGGVAASIDMNQIRKTFSIAPDSEDGKMLSMVEKGLKFVREIRPGDSIPNELLDGTASWQIEPKHYERARSKVLLQLVRWMTDGNSAIDPNADVMKLIESPEVKSKINDAFGAAARQLGVQEMDKEMITGMISHLSNELAYIEALRDKVAGYLIIRRKLKDLQQVYRTDRRVAETLERVVALIGVPFNKLREQFQLVDAQTAEVMSSLRQLTATVGFLRGVRDELREFVLVWGDMDTAWMEIRAQRCGPSEAIVTRTYRFVATHYSMTQRWAMNVS
ncbi:MAG TPA: hypothetical protein VGG27_16525 [Magnetospirillaceae bacterium]|jgi:hypothetical protein